jgi:hypothetical protein
MSDPLLGFKRDIHESLKVIETVRSTVTPSSRLILERPSEGRWEENGPFSLPFCQIVALMLPQRSV